MFEPLTQTVSQLAVRWNCSVQDVLTHAVQRNWPLYFYFDGLVIDVNDRENRFGGCDRQVQEVAELERVIHRSEETLSRNALHAHGKLEMTQWEQILDVDAMRALRTATDENKRLLRRLRESIEAWHEGRRRFHRNGAVRAAPATIQSIADRGVVSFPIRAYHPESAAWYIPNPDGPGHLLEGRLVALEDMGPHPKEKLKVEDLFASMADIKAIDGETRQMASTPSNAVEGAIPAIDHGGEKMKKAALVSKYKKHWPSVEADIDNASRTELKNAKRGTGYYDVAAALNWARQEGKFSETTATPAPAHSIFNSPISVKRTQS